MTNDANRYPDIEIYLKAVDNDAVVAWLQKRFEDCEAGSSAGNVSHHRVSYQGDDIPVMVVIKALGIFTSVLFNSNQTPWETDRECALEALQEFETEIRCNLGSWSEGDDPDEWLSLSSEGEKLIQWRG